VIEGAAGLFARLDLLVDQLRPTFRLLSRIAVEHHLAVAAGPKGGVGGVHLLEHGRRREKSGRPFADGKRQSRHSLGSCAFS
jgi:hypothetical protein